ncbi:PQQ-binding-like beta-propeller repeat protein [Dyadobacter sp. BHUBP1]|uniref:outer membrane protein assembly factor BamB family protein n=1 Tax=Dyadobacter sp. BHUBP1 TaxID=3424178 RepID=UPI003D32EF13
MKKQLNLFLLCLILIIPAFAQQPLLWKFSTAGGIHGAPAVTDKVVYVGSNDMNLYALDKATGRQLWKYATAGAIRSTPAVTASKVLFNSADGNIYAVDKKKGTLLWTFKTGGEQHYDLWDYYLSSPVAVGNALYAGSGDSSVYAIDLESGKLRWRFKTGGVVHASPVVRNGKVFIGSYDGYFYVLDAQNGNLAWKFKTLGDPGFPKGEVQRAAYVDDDQVIFGSRDFYIYCLNAQTGEQKWNMKEKGSWVIATPIVHKGNLFVGTSDTHQFYSMNAETGKINWIMPLNMRVYGTAVVVEDKLVFGCFNGRVYFADPATGKVIKTFRTDESKKNHALVYDDTDHFRKDFDMYGDNYIQAEKHILSLGSILSGPVATGGMLYFGDANGYFYALDIRKVLNE